MSYEVRIHRYDVTDPRLGRHVHHDGRNWSYAVEANPYQAPTSVRHHSNIPVLDQQDLGACTGFAAIGLMGYDRYYIALNEDKKTRLDRIEARNIYSEATGLDGIPGRWPPEDTGSDGISAAKALKRAGFISGYKHAFSASAFMTALMAGPVMVGTAWYNSMFKPTRTTGTVTVDTDSGLAGGHEYIADEYESTSDCIGFRNSWGTGFGLDGRFYMSRFDFLELLADKGDVTVPVPLTLPAPTPTPPPAPSVDADALAAYKALKVWATRNGVA